MTAPLLLFALAFVPMIAEASRSRRHERALRAAGAIEPQDDVYKMMQLAYPASFLAMVAEGWVRGGRAGVVFVIGLAVFLLAKALKYWAIAALGPRWTFRVLVPPGAPLVVRGPYKLMRHPNYAGVAGELVGAALMAPAPIAGTASALIFGGLLRARIRVEERALDGRAR